MNGGLTEAMKMRVITLREANAFVKQHHRHHSATRGCKFVLGLEHGGELVAVLIAGRPVARNTDWREVCEVTRLCATGTKNSCSILYGAAARIATEMGFKRIQTFLLNNEAGTSVKAAGWALLGLNEGGAWSRPARPRGTAGLWGEQQAPTCAKQRWGRELSPPRWEVKDGSRDHDRRRGAADGAGAVHAAG